MAYFGRGKNKLQNPYTMNDFFDYYKEQTCGNKLYDIPKSLYVEIVSYYFKRIIEMIMLEGETFKLPSNLGIMYVGKKKMNFNSEGKSISIDWKNTNKYGKLIFFTNDHCNNYKYRFVWSRRDAAVKNIRKYHFIPSRTNKRALASIIFNKERDYFEIE